MLMPAPFSALTAIVAALFRRQVAPWVPAVLKRVLRDRESYKILRAVIRFVAVYMVNVFKGFQSAAIGLFPDKSVFKDVASSIGRGMLRRIDVPIARLVLKAATLPLRMFWPALAAHVVTMKKRHRLGPDIPRLTIRIVDGNLFATTATAECVQRNPSGRTNAPLIGASRFRVMPVYEPAGLAFHIAVVSVGMGGWWDRVSTTTFAQRIHQVLLYRGTSMITQEK